MSRQPVQSPSTFFAIKLREHGVAARELPKLGFVAATFVAVHGAPPSSY
jgi:hypothetical protein